MARNKHPEETLAKIVDTAARLFCEQGYENTSIQDIINHLGGLSKGAIYHHFRSKEDILLAVMDLIYGYQTVDTFLLAGKSETSGFARLQKILEASVASPAQIRAFSMRMNLMKSPKIMVEQLQASVEEVARQIILPVLLDGMADGSIPHLAYPQEFAECFSLLCNIWVNPMVYPASPEEVRRKCLYLQDLMRRLGFTQDLLSSAMVDSIVYYTQLYNAPRSSSEA